MDKKGKSAIILGITAMLVLVTFTAVAIAHINSQGKQTHPVGIETESCQDAYAGAEEQFQDRGDVDPHLLANIEEKCGFEFDENCRIEFDAAHEPVLICEEETPQCEEDCRLYSEEVFEACVLAGGDAENCKMRADAALEACLISCEETPQCVEVSPEEVSSGACTDISSISELNIPPCCTLKGPGGIDCGADQKWVVGIAAFPTCYISNS